MGSTINYPRTSAYFSAKIAYRCLLFLRCIFSNSQSGTLLDRPSRIIKNNLEVFFKGNDIRPAQANLGSIYPFIVMFAKEYMIDTVFKKCPVPLRSRVAKQKQIGPLESDSEFDVAARSFNPTISTVGIFFPAQPASPAFMASSQGNPRCAHYSNVLTRTALVLCPCANPRTSSRFPFVPDTHAFEKALSSRLHRYAGHDTAHFLDAKCHRRDL